MDALADRVLVLGPKQDTAGPYRHFKLRRDGDGIAWLLFDREGSSANTLSADVMEEFDRVLAELENQRPAGLVIRSAKASGFIAGADVNEFRGASDPNMVEAAIGRAHAVIDRLEALRVPTIAALNGSVYGGATDLALACDFRIGVEGMRLLMPASRLGIVYYASGIRRYVTRLGVAAAKKLFLTAQPIDAAEMLRIGYLDEIVSAADLMNRAEALAATLAANAPLAVVGLKRAINEAAVGTLDRDALGTVRALCAASADHAEGVRAWTEKRAPVFAGR